VSLHPLHLFPSFRLFGISAVLHSEVDSDSLFLPFSENVTGTNMQDIVDFPVIGVPMTILTYYCLLTLILFMYAK
jgi:hypothetical protein